MLQTLRRINLSHSAYYALLIRSPIKTFEDRLYNNGGYIYFGLEFIWIIDALGTRVALTFLR